MDKSQTWTSPYEATRQAGLKSKKAEILKKLSGASILVDGLYIKMGEMTLWIHTD